MKRKYKLSIKAAAMMSLLVFTSVHGQQNSLSKSLQPPKQALVELEAERLLHSMTDYLNSLKQFSVHTVNLREDTLVSDHRVDFEVATNRRVF